MQRRIVDSNNNNIVRLPISSEGIYSYPFMRKFNFKKIAQLFEQLSRLTISAYLKVVYLHQVKKRIRVSGELRVQTEIKNYYKKILFPFEKNNFFDFENLGKNCFQIVLRNALGNLLMYNCGMQYHLYVPDEFYTLSKYAQFLYRKIIANGFGTDHEYPLEMIAEWLNFRNTTITQLNKKIIDVLEELKAFGYVEYEYHPLRRHNWYSIKKKRKRRDVSN